MNKHTCTFPQCDNPHCAKGLCNGHYRQKREGQELRPLQPSSRGLSLGQRFWAKVEKTDDCWLWMAATGSHGYGHIKVDGQMRLVHRVAWKIVNGPIPEGMHVDHRCHNKCCVNPCHLRIVTHAQNLQNRIGAQANSASGVRGVSWNKDMNAWQAYAKLNGRQYHGGYHNTIEAADEAARALRAQLHSHDDHHEWLANQTEKGTR